MAAHAAAAGGAPYSLLHQLMVYNASDVPGELLDLVAAATLAMDLPSALRLLQACTALRGRLAAMRAAAEARRLRWVAELTETDKLAISEKGRALTKVGHGNWAWAAGSLLPTAGRVSFSVRIEESKSKGCVIIGVCNEAGTCAWGLNSNGGELNFRTRNANGEVGRNAPPPEGWPDGEDTQVLVNEAGKPDGLDCRANGAVIEVVVDQSDGSLAFGVNGAPPQRVPDTWPPGYDPREHLDEDWNVIPGHVPPAKVPFKFPQGARLRPWARLWKAVGDKTCFARRYLAL